MKQEYNKEKNQRNRILHSSISLDTVAKLHICFIASSQILKQTRWFTLSDKRKALFFCAICPVRENNLSHGTDATDVAKYLHAGQASLVCVSSHLDHHYWGQSSMPIAGSAL